MRPSPWAAEWYRCAVTNASGPGGDETRPKRVSLGRGISVPYPSPSTEAATAKARANRRTGSKPELALRSALHRRGLRFRKDLLVRFSGGRTHPDVVFTRARVAVFVDGCFWHCCPIHGTTPKANPGYWIPKLAANVARDRRVDQALQDEGWEIVRVWEHESPFLAADRIERIVRHRTQGDL